MRGAPIALALLACGSLLALPPAAADAADCALPLGEASVADALDAKHGAEALAAAAVNEEVAILTSAMSQLVLDAPTPGGTFADAFLAAQVGGLDAGAAAGVGLADGARERATRGAMDALHCATMM